MRKKQVKRDIKFNKRASVYDEQFEGIMSEKVYRLVTNTIQLSPEDKILDVGCGTGTILKRLNDKCRIEGFGIDIEEKMIEQAKKKCPQMKIQICDCSNTPFEDNTFDSVIACMTFHHFYNQTAFAKEISRILKKGGKLYLADPSFPFLLRKIINMILYRHNLVGKFSTVREIDHLFHSHGLMKADEKKAGLFQLIVFSKC